jgi:hypothetical protein
MQHFEGEKGENPLYFRKCNAYYAFRVWSIEDKCDCVGEYDLHNNNNPEKKE